MKRELTKKVNNMEYPIEYELNIVFLKYKKLKNIT